MRHYVDNAIENAQSVRIFDLHGREVDPQQVRPRLYVPRHYGDYVDRIAAAGLVVGGIVGSDSAGKQYEKPLREQSNGAMTRRSFLKKAARIVGGAAAFYALGDNAHADDFVIELNVPGYYRFRKTFSANSSVQLPDIYLIERYTSPEGDDFLRLFTFMTGTDLPGFEKLQKWPSYPFKFWIGDEQNNPDAKKFGPTLRAGAAAWENTGTFLKVFDIVAGPQPPDGAYAYVVYRDGGSTMQVRTESLAPDANGNTAYRRLVLAVNKAATPTEGLIRTAAHEEGHLMGLTNHDPRMGRIMSTAIERSIQPIETRERDGTGILPNSNYMKDYD